MDNDHDELIRQSMERLASRARPVDGLADRAWRAARQRRYATTVAAAAAGTSLAVLVPVGIGMHGAGPDGLPAVVSSTGQQEPRQTSSPTPTKVAEDPTTLPGAFPRDSVRLGGRTYHKVADDLTKTCAEAGRQGFGAVLEEAGCTRVLRATYVDDARTYAVTIGMAVLPSKADATEVRSSVDLDKVMFAKPLRGSPGAEQLAESSGFGAYDIVGRYFVFVFAAHSDGDRAANEEERKDLSTQASAFRHQMVERLSQRAGDTN